MNEPSRSKDKYFVNAPVDFLIIGGGSLACYFFFRFNRQAASSPQVLSLAALLVWVCNYPHFASTNYRLYRTKSNIRQYPMTATVTPILMTGAAVAAYLAPATVAPFLVKLYLLWSPYHFSGQTLGITLVYARRSGFTISNIERKALAGFIFLTFIVQNARAEVGVRTATFYGVSYPTLGVPTWLPHILSMAMWVCGGGFAALLAWRVASRRGIVPAIVLLPAVAQYAWFVALPPGNFNYLVPFFHSLQYLLIAWSVQLKETLDEKNRTPSTRYVLSESARWAVLCFIGGYVLFWALPHLGAHFGRPAAFSTAIMLTVVQLHHFFVDGVIWKLRNPAVRSPMLTTLRQVAGRSGQVEPVPALVSV